MKRSNFRSCCTLIGPLGFIPLFRPDKERYTTVLLSEVDDVTTSVSCRARNNTSFRHIVADDSLPTARASLHLYIHQNFVNDRRQRVRCLQLGQLLSLRQGGRIVQKAVGKKPISKSAPHHSSRARGK